MPILPITEQSWLFAPPLDMPLALRLEDGRFGSLRPRPLPSAPPCATTHVIADDDPVNPTGGDVFFATGLHEAVDLASTAGACVYAAYSGRVVEVNRDPAATKGNVTIDHHPPGLGFVTQYIHIAAIAVEAGAFVHEGQPIAQVSAVPEQPTLHFELRAAVGGDETAPVDPTRTLYAWEQRLVPDEPLAGPRVPRSVGVTRVHTLPFFVAAFDDALTLHVPLYEPVPEDDRLLIGLLRDAHARAAAVELTARRSAFWGLDVVTQAVATA